MGARQDEGTGETIADLLAGASPELVESIAAEIMGEVFGDVLSAR